MKIKNYVKENVWEVVAIFIFSLTSFLIFKETLLTITSFFFSLFISLVIFYFGYKKEILRDQEISTLKFLSSYLLKITDGFSCKNSYELAIRHLIGKVTIIPYETIIDNPNSPYFLGKYNSFFILTLNKEKENEVHLPNYYPLLEDLEETINEFQNEIIKSKRMKLCLISLSLIFSLMFLTSTLVLTNLYENLFNSNFKYLLVFIFICIIPLIELYYVLSLERAKKYVN